MMESAHSFMECYVQHSKQYMTSEFVPKTRLIISISKHCFTQSFSRIRPICLYIQSVICVVVRTLQTFIFVLQFLSAMCESQRSIQTKSNQINIVPSMWHWIYLLHNICVGNSIKCAIFLRISLSANFPK